MPNSDYRRERAALLHSKAEKYLRHAETTPDPQERNKLFDYAALYAQMSARSVSGDDPTAAAEKERGR